MTKLLRPVKPCQEIIRTQVQLRGRMKWHDYSATKVIQAQSMGLQTHAFSLYDHAETALEKNAKARRKLTRLSGVRAQS